MTQLVELLALQRGTELGGKSSYQSFEGRVEAVGGVEATGAGDVTDLHIALGEQVLGVPDPRRGEAYSALISPSPEGTSPRLSQLDSQFIERGALCVKRLRRRPVVVLHPWTAYSDENLNNNPVRKKRPDGMKLARHYQALLDSGKFENRAALARHLGVSRARVTQVLWRLKQ